MNKTIEVFWRFLILGCTSFGGPAAHIGYFQTAFVGKYKWLDNKQFGQLVALSQFLPGPGSSQLGFAIGLERAGLLGGIAAFIGFTLPSFILMALLAILGSQFADTVTFSGLVNGLKLLAVVVVADAILSMSKSFCQQWFHRAVALATVLVLVVIASSTVQLLMLVLAAIAGAVWKSNIPQSENPAPKLQLNWFAMSLFLLFFVGLPFVSQQAWWLSLTNEFYQAGSLVFGGGHVVLPLLQQNIGSQLPAEQFLTGYAAAQAVPGPMFTLATYLGPMVAPDNAWLAATLATIAVFLPGFLLILTFKNAWKQLSGHLRIASALASVNAAVVGILIAALYQPIAMSAIHSPADIVLVIAGFILLKWFRLPMVAMVLSFAALGVIRIL